MYDRAVLIAGACLTLSCVPDAEEQPEARTAEPVLPAPILELTSIEREARSSLDQERRAAEKASKLKASVKKAMTTSLFDPGSAQYMSLRAGRSDAVCGKVNAKNRYGAYVGYKDFVLSKDGETVYISTSNDALRSDLYGSFAEAYLNACATKREAAAHAETTKPLDYEAPVESQDPFEDF